MDTLFHTFFYFFAPPNALSLVETQDVFVIMHIIRGKLYFVLEHPFIKKNDKTYFNIGFTKVRYSGGNAL